MTVQYRSSATGTNPAGVNASAITCNKPSGTLEGDLMVAILSGAVGAITAPAGWTEMASLTDTTVLRSAIFTKRAGGSEPANYTFTFALSGSNVVSITSFLGAGGILMQDLALTDASNPATGRTLGAAADSVAYQFFAWRDNATATMSGGHGAEKFDVAINNTGSTIWRGLAAWYYGPPSPNDIVNAGDALPSVTVTQSQAVGFGINGSILITSSNPDNEDWSATDGDFAVELKLDDVHVDSTGGIESELKCDITTRVVTVTSSDDNPPSELDDNLRDGLPDTKWLANDPTAWAQYQLDQARPVRRYRLRSGNDFQTRDPYNWTLQGSNNGTDFTVLDTRTAQSFANRMEMQEFKVASPGEYLYYRLDITQNNGSANTQLAEWRISSADIWEDVTSYVIEEDKIRITRGFQGTSGRHDFSRAYYGLNNTDGRFSTRNQDSAYFGALQRNTQTRISKAFGTKTLQLQGDMQLEGTDMVGDCARTPTSAAMMFTGDFEVRIDLQLESWRDDQMLTGVATGDGTTSWYLWVADDGKLNFLRNPVASGITTFVSTKAVPQALRQSLRVTVDTDNGASGTTVTFYTADTIAGPWVQLGDPVIDTTAVGATDFFGGALCIGHVGGVNRRGLHGMVYAYELYDGIGGTAVTDIDFSTVDNGAHSWTDSNSNEWLTINNAVVSNRRYRFHGEVSEWPLAWDPTGTWITCSATGAGIQKRLEKSAAEESSMYRYHTKGIIDSPGAFERFAEPYAYWPMEDEKGAFEIASGVPGKPAMQIYGAPNFEAQSDFNESKPLPELKLAKIGGRVAGNPTGYADIRWMMYSETTLPTNSNILTLYSSGNTKKFTVDYTATNTWRIRGFNENDAGTVGWDTGTFTVDTVDEFLHCQLILDESGSNVLLTLNVYDTQGTQVHVETDTFASTTLGRVYRVNSNDVEATAAKMNEVTIGHIAVYGFDSPPFLDGLNAHHYEKAADRIARLAAEEEIEFRRIGSAEDSAYMGFQNVGNAFESMASASVSDSGYLIDPLDAFGVEYRTGRSLLNQAAALTVSYSGNELSGNLNPVEDDSYIVNDFTASRGGAGGARYRLDEGPLSANPPPLGVGDYTASQSFSLAHEGQCVDIASWEVHKGSLDEERYPRIELALENLRIAASSAQTERILLIDVGDRLDIIDMPDFMPAHDVRQIIIGYEETFDNFQHGFKLNAIPERVFETAEYNSWYHFDTNGTELYQDTTSTEETLTLNTTSGPKWTDDPRMMPYNLAVDGEVIRVTAPGTTTTTNPFFDDGVTGWTGSAASVAASTQYVMTHPDATTSLLLTPDGSLANASAIAPSPGKAVTPGNQYTACGWVLAPLGYDACRVTVNWYDSGSVLLSTSTVTSVSVSAAKWTFIDETLTAPASAAFARVVCGQTNSPTGSEVTYWWGVRVTDRVATHTDSYIADTFDRANNAASMGSTNGGTITAWVPGAGTWGIDANQAYISVAANSYTTTTGAADLEEVSVVVSSWASGEAWLNFRYTDGNNRIRFGGTVATAAQLQFISGGVTTRTVVADSGDFTLAAGDKLSVRCNGSVIECYIDNVLALCVNDTTQQTATRAGIQTATTVPRFNNYFLQTSDALQVYTVERSVNGVVRPHAARSGVKLDRSPYRGL